MRQHRLVRFAKLHDWYLVYELVVPGFEPLKRQRCGLRLRLGLDIGVGDVGGNPRVKEGVECGETFTGIFYEEAPDEVEC
jgi:hypothetical protein